MDKSFTDVYTYVLEKKRGIRGEFIQECGENMYIHFICRGFIREIFPAYCDINKPVETRKWRITEACIQQAETYLN